MFQRANLVALSIDSQTQWWQYGAERWPRLYFLEFKTMRYRASLKGMPPWLGAAKNVPTEANLFRLVRRQFVFAPLH